ncbi:tape measure protein [Enterococcus entomosocium]|uniref:tape measure protein n=1 Tax=Enterococcus entomosocium TaxID=3034352 RepID=UPI002647AC95|nr:tape measure protein [Enterococcus entomosocium]
MESYSVEAILSAVDKNFTSTMKDADNSMGGLNENTKKTNTSILDIAKGVGVFKLVDKAIGVVTSSLGGAIDRFDTFKQYPNVMRQLGYSTEEVDRSMSKLTEGIDGLPTTLDDIVKNAQSLTMTTGDLDKGTESAIALNNAFLASGASSADASRGLTQYTQMLAKGKVDMQSWNSLTDTMGLSLGEVAKSFGMTGAAAKNDLYDALKEGTITFDQFNDKMIEMYGIGTDGAELAKANSKGVATSIQNLQTAVKNGIAGILEEINLLLGGSDDFNAIAATIDKAKPIITNAFIAIRDAIPPTISFLTDLWNTIEPFLPLIMAIVGYIAIYQGVMGTARKAVELYNGAQKMMNVLMNLNPIGLVIAAVIALVAGFIYLWNTSEGFRNFWIGLWEGIQSVVGAAVDWIVSAWEGVAEFFSNAWNGTVEASKKAAEGAKQAWQNTKQWFADLWQGIKDSATDMWEGTKQAFSDGVDNIVSVWDGITQWFSDLWNGIKSTVTSIVQGIADGIMSRFGTLVYGVRNAFIHMSFFLRTLWTNLAKIAGQIFEIMKNVILAPVLLVTSLISGGWEEAKNNMIGIWNNIQTAALEIWASITAILDSFLVNTKMAFLNIWNGIKAALEYIWTTIQTIATETFNSMVAFFVETWTNIKQGTIDAWEGLKTWLSETWDSIKQIAIDTWNSVKQFFIDLWESIKTNTINMWNGIKDGVTTTWENTKNAVINIATGLVDGANQAWENMKKGVSNAVDRVKETFDTIREIDLLQIGKDIIDGLVKGIRSKIDDVVSAVQDVANTITGKVKDILNIHSPSRVMAELGVFTSQGLAEGMLDGSKYVEKASDTLADKASNMDIGNRISAVNSQIQSKVQHEVSYGTNNKPALFNIQLGNQVFQAFVEDINEAQGNGINVNMQF